MANHQILTESELHSALQRLRDWSLKGQNIEAGFEFATFRDAIAFVVQIAIEAETAGHHPEIRISYKRVAFSLCTHDAGFRITDRDIEMASRISAAAHRFQSMT
ncbi:MAG: 4a-hydroxytetrahydrobiopterin dehydratase [Roseiarcus sp.]|jgi:4a-hydroxytetrahydrobiopterin dehydratase